MKKYIGTKQIEAEPMKMGEADEKCLNCSRWKANKRRTVYKWLSCEV